MEDEYFFLLVMLAILPLAEKIAIFTLSLADWVCEKLGILKFLRRPKFGDVLCDTCPGRSRCLSLER